MNQNLPARSECPDTSGTLPSCTPLAVPFVPFQQENASVYDKDDALSQGTLFPGLNLPFHLAVNGRQVPMTPLSQLQALQFVLQELALYLDTHEDDTEAFSLFRHYADLLKSARAAYEKDNGPLTHMAAAGDKSWQWLCSPWPWEPKGGK